MGTPARIDLPSGYCTVADMKVTGSACERGCQWVSCAHCSYTVALAKSFSICAKSKSPGPSRNVESSENIAAPSRCRDGLGLSLHPVQKPIQVIDHLRLRSVILRGHARGKGLGHGFVAESAVLPPNAALGPTSRAPYFLIVSYEPVADIVRPISSAQPFFRPWRAASGAASAACAPAQVESRLGVCRARRA